MSHFGRLRCLEAVEAGEMTGTSPKGPGALDDDELFADIYPSLYRFACVVASAETDPDDLIQEATARALRRGRLSDLDHPLAYLRRAVANLASNERRRLGRQRRALQVLGTPPPVDPEYVSDVADVLALPPDVRAVLWLAEVEGATFDEIARQLGCTPEAARQRASRGRRTLRRLLTEEEVR